MIKVPKHVAEKLDSFMDTRQIHVVLGSAFGSWGLHSVLMDYFFPKGINNDSTIAFLSAIVNGYEVIEKYEAIDGVVYEDGIELLHSDEADIIAHHLNKAYEKGVSKCYS